MNSQMAVFGGGHDLVLGMTVGKRQTGGNLKEGSSNIGAGSYRCPAGHDGRTLLTGEQSFTAVEIEVFRVTHPDTDQRWASPPPSPRSPAIAARQIHSANDPQSAPLGTDVKHPASRPAVAPPLAHRSTLDSQPHLGELIERVLLNERNELQTAQDALGALEAACDEEAAFAQVFNGETKDVVDLDVSGELVSVKRSTLMLCKTSALARQFDDTTWSQRPQDGGVSTDGNDENEDNATFIEQPTYAFIKLIDQLRLISITPGNPHRRQLSRCTNVRLSNAWYGTIFQASRASSSSPSLMGVPDLR